MKNSIPEVASLLLDTLAESEKARVALAEKVAFLGTQCCATQDATHDMAEHRRLNEAYERARRVEAILHAC